VGRRQCGGALALTFTVHGADPGELLKSRQDEITVRMRALAARRERLVAAGHLRPMQAAVMRRGGAADAG